MHSYLSSVDLGNIDVDFLCYLANLTKVKEVSPQTAAAVVRELADQRSNLKLIASENYCSLSVQAAMANLLTDKYAEGFPQHRFYAGCDNVDDVEALACAEACKLFGCDHAYVQPHSGADANMIAFWAILHARIGAKMMEQFGQTKMTDLSLEQWRELRSKLGNQVLLGMDYSSGGHLTHGYRYNVSAQMFDAHSYTVDRETRLLNYDEIERQALALKPLILLAGYSAYPRALNFERLRQIADKTGAVLMVDMAHFAGLVAGQVFHGTANPIPYADVVTTTTHKTLRGPRGGLVLCRKEFAEYVDKGCPYVIGGPLAHVMAAKAICFTEANRPEFKTYAGRIVDNAQILAESLVSEGISITTGGTDNHLMLLDVAASFGITGRQAEEAVRECGITLNRNSLPFDPNGAWFTSGLRIGTPAVTTLGMGHAEMKEIAAIFKLILSG
ncbi:MAG TPA: glycine hydroxymethyltransferase, partial [Oligoflexia bacterium]|nr:glycine hydroxymethyltransferase [Oligoflexia bacterium]